MAFKIDRDALGEWLQSKLDEHVRPEVQALVRRGNITLSEWKEFRGNSWEFEHMYCALDDEAFVYAVEHNLANCAPRERPCASYDETCTSILAPELLRRFKSRAERAAPVERTPETVLRAMLRAYEKATHDACVLYFKTTDPREERTWQDRARQLHRQCEVIRRESAAVCAGHQAPVGFDAPGELAVQPTRILADYEARLRGVRPLDAPPSETDHG
jgi:hypothetical protein